MTPPDDRLLAVSRYVERIIAEIADARDAAEVLDLRRRASERTVELPHAIDRGRLQERLDDAANARLQELET
jgi:hypothetical protein